MSIYDGRSGKGLSRKETTIALALAYARELWWTSLLSNQAQRFSDAVLLLNTCPDRLRFHHSGKPDTVVTEQDRAIHDIVRLAIFGTFPWSEKALTYIRKNTGLFRKTDIQVYLAQVTDSKAIHLRSLQSYLHESNTQ